MRQRIGTILVLSITVAAGALVAPPPTLAASPPCQVTNVTRDKRGDSFPAMVASARAGDVLDVRGHCESAGAMINREITIRGKGTDPGLVGPTDRWALRIGPGVFQARIQHLTIRSRARVHQQYDYDYWKGGPIHNEGHVEFRHVILRRGPSQNDGALRMTDSRAPELQNSGTAVLIRFDTRQIINGGALVLRDSVVHHGYVGDDPGAGGITNWGTAQIIRTRIVDNRGEAASAGGIDNTGSMTLLDSLVARNEGFLGSAAGIFSNGDLVLVGTVVRDNDGDVGGIDNSGDLVLSDSQVTGNTGGGIQNDQPGTVSLRGSSSVNGNDPYDCDGTPAC